MIRNDDFKEVERRIFNNKHLTRDSIVSLAEYLESHEQDIAFSINDYGHLRTLFVDLFNRLPEQG